MRGDFCRGRGSSENYILSPTVPIILRNSCNTRALQRFFELWVNCCVSHVSKSRLHFGDLCLGTKIKTESCKHRHINREPVWVVAGVKDSLTDRDDSPKKDTTFR